MTEEYHVAVATRKDYGGLYTVVNEKEVDLCGQLMEERINGARVIKKIGPVDKGVYRNIQDGVLVAKVTGKGIDWGRILRR